MTFFVKFLICAAFVAVTYSRSFSIENSLVQLELQETNCSCDWRYFKHYETKGCVVEITDSCGCPQKFTCPFNNTQQPTAKVCTYLNKEYKVGSKILVSDSCQVCRCHDGVPPYISCVTKECPELTETSNPDCHLVYEENKCCPVSIECFKNEAEISSNRTCEYNGRFYPFGSKIYPVDDPCQVCTCDEKWNNADNSSCHQHDCMLEKNKAKLDAGCIPVYHETLCCPVEFYCPSSHNLSYSVLSSNESLDNTSDENQCSFANQFYALEEELLIGNPCVKCSCVVSPDFTCVHQTCPPPPSEGSCDVNYNPGECCPTYECMLGDIESHPDCPTPLCADRSCKIETPFGHRCPTCVCLGCPTPICADSTCRIEIPPGHDCPTCVCGENASELEHNNLEQAHLPNQNMEQQFEHFQEVFEHRESSDDSSEDELQIMPIRMQATEGDSDGQFPIMPTMEKMIFSEFEAIDQHPEVLRELEESSFEDNYSTEASIISLDEVENSTFLPDIDLDEISSNKSVSNESEKVFQKRSEVSDAANNGETEAIPDQQQASSQQEAMDLPESDIEREGEDSDGKTADIDEELESFKNKILGSNKTIINEIISINHVVKVPPGCPTPMCEGPWCKIGILPGEKCPTCICKRHSEP